MTTAKNYADTIFTQTFETSDATSQCIDGFETQANKERAEIDRGLRNKVREGRFDIKSHIPEMLMGEGQKYPDNVDHIPNKGMVEIITLPDGGKKFVKVDRKVSVFSNISNEYCDQEAISTYESIKREERMRAKARKNDNAIKDAGTFCG